MSNASSYLVGHRAVILVGPPALFVGTALSFPSKTCPVSMIANPAQVLPTVASRVVPTPFLAQTTASRVFYVHSDYSLPTASNAGLAKCSVAVSESESQTLPPAWHTTKFVTAGITPVATCVSLAYVLPVRMQISLRGESQTPQHELEQSTSQKLKILRPNDLYGAQPNRFIPIFNFENRKFEFY